jgi:hypothetical protein
MHYVLFFVLFTAQPNIDPIMGHKPFATSQQCEAAKEEVLKQPLPEGVRGAAICISDAELLNYTRT